MKLFLTGATGFVGRNCLLAALRGRYEEVFTAVRSEKKLRTQCEAEQIAPAASQRIKTLGADPAQWPEIDADHAILSAGVLFARDRAEYFSTNVDWMMQVIAALPSGCRIILISSQSAGGPTPPERERRTEDDPDQPITWYGESKLAMEHAVRAAFPDRDITILRPPMILGPRDTATLPLFRMGRGLIRPKPGLRAKSYSFIAVDDLVEAAFTVLDASYRSSQSYYVASRQIFTDWDLIAAAVTRPGLTVPVPEPAVRLLSAVVDAVPALREQTPSLTRDRAREIWPSRWVVDGSAFTRLTGWEARRSLLETMQATLEHYRAAGLL